MNSIENKQNNMTAEFLSVKVEIFQQFELKKEQFVVLLYRQHSTSKECDTLGRGLIHFADIHLL
jgi:hypothetical protein